MIYIAFLRGINVSGHKIIKMADLRSLLEDVGFQDVLTYIQSGNIVFKSAVQLPTKLENIISNTILDQYGFEIPVIVKQRSEIEGIMANNPFTDPKDIDENKVYFVLLKTEPKAEKIKALSALKFENEELVITPKCVYLKCALGAGKAKCDNNLIERKLQVEATTRNPKTLLKLLDLSSD
ncbi:DUF1697 domain-containing protein [Maribacter arenosus]|uniref:DUF1697 domain-containing protein n=1 Tax=Maribacter arenosus TaxID=1854708 RepID=A0ABR7VDA0_9FLAO|nr:DUF1697 domain-containing protein [Maribacter arenosus]MBD0851602.1 DUF1697 domain-containing protein [Maribacter arenosus]